MLSGELLLAPDPLDALNAPERREAVACKIASARFAAMILAFLLARVCHAQLFGEKLPEPYRFASLVADLEAARVDVPPMILVEVYRRAIDRFGHGQSEIRAALRKVTGPDARIHVGLADVDRALQLVRRARASGEGAEEALFNDLAAAVPEQSRARIEQVRAWRQTQRALPRFFAAPSMVHFVDVGDVVRRSGLSADELDAAMRALAPSEATRRSAFLRIQREADEAMRAVAKVVDEAGMAGSVQSVEYRWERLTPEEREFMTRRSEAQKVGGPAVAEGMDAQLKALRAVRDSLPRRQRRIVFDALTPGLIGGLPGGGDIGLPGNARLPSDVSRMVLSASDLSRAQREAARSAIKVWIDDDDELVLAGLADIVTALRTSKDPSTDIAEVARELRTRRSDLSRSNLANLAKATSAGWLADRSMPPPKLDEANLTDEDRAAIGVGRPRSAPLTQSSAVVSRNELLPAPIDQPAIDAWSSILAHSDEERIVADRIVREHAGMFEANVRPTIETALELSQMLRLDGVRRVSMNEIDSVAAALAELRRKAFTDADQVDDALAQALVGALGEASIPVVRRAIGARRLDQSVMQLVRALSEAGSIDIERLGGRPCNVAEIVADTGLSPGVRAAIEAAMVDDWSASDDVARQARDEAIDAARGRAMVWSGVEGGGEPSARSPDPQRRADALAATLERWWPVEDALVARAIDVAAASGDADGAMGRAIERARFSEAYRELVLIDAAEVALRGVEGFANREALLAEINACRASLALMSRRRADTMRERVKLSAVPAAERVFLLSNRGWDGGAIMLVQLQLFDATTWMIEKATPKEILGASPDLRSLRRSMGW